MDLKERMDTLLESIPQEKRGELAKKLLEAESLENRIAIAKEYIGDQTAEGAPEWLSSAYELTDEDLDKIAGGIEMPWDNEVDEYGCY